MTELDALQAILAALVVLVGFHGFDVGRRSL